jgi:hypothetical protein
MSSKEKLKKLELLKLSDSLTIGDLDSKENLNVTEFVWEFERELILHRGKGCKKFVRWKDKTRLKELLSAGFLKKIWWY